MNYKVPNCYGNPLGTKSHNVTIVGTMNKYNVFVNYKVPNCYGNPLGTKSHNVTIVGTMNKYNVNCEMLGIELNRKVVYSYERKGLYFGLISSKTQEAICVFVQQETGVF